MLRKLLKEKNISQIRVVKETGISMSGLHNYMNGKREMPVSVAKKIAPILKVNWWELYEDE